MASTIDNIKAVNAAFGYTFPKEIAFPEKGRWSIKDKETKKQRAPATCGEVTAINNAKAWMYIPVLKAVGYGDIYNGMKNEKNPPSVEDKAFFARATISEALGPILGGLVLLIADIFFTIFVKPFLNLAVHILNKKAEEEAKEAKALEEINKNAPPVKPTTPAEPVKEGEKVEAKTTEPSKDPSKPDDGAAKVETAQPTESTSEKPVQTDAKETVVTTTSSEPTAQPTTTDTSVKMT